MNKKVYYFLIFSSIIVVLICIKCLFYNDLDNQQFSKQIENTFIEDISNTNKEITNKQESTVVVLPSKEDSNIKISVIGDIMCHNSQYIDAYDSVNNTYDFTYVFDDIKDNLLLADYTIANLETTFAGKERGYSNYPNFNTPEQLGIALKNVGVDLLSTANNHCMDTGYSGLCSTLNYLDEYGLLHCGTNRSTEEQSKIVTQEINGIKVAFLAFTYGTNGINVSEEHSYSVNFIDYDLMYNQIELAKKENPDLICVNIHWGIEYQNVENTTQEECADFLFKNGVDIILGSHPHVLQPMEKKEVLLDNGVKKNCFVIYSLGNFMSGQTKNYTRSSIILNLNIKKNGNTDETTIEDISYIPIYTYKSGKSSKKYKVINMIKAINKYELGENGSVSDNDYQILKSENERIQKMYEGFLVYNE